MKIITKIPFDEISDGGAFSISLDKLSHSTKYYYCTYVKQNDIYTYLDVDDFTTKFITDLTMNSSANCYIVSSAGDYTFKTVKGNSNESVGNVANAEVLWESFGTSTAPSVGDLVNTVSYADGYITFYVTGQRGNAVIAAKDSSGKILWSWHIWLTDEPQGQVYYNNASALGLLYQWGRKDPFLLPCVRICGSLYQDVRVISYGR